MRVASNLLQRVGGRAGTAAPQGAVCELPNPLLFLPGRQIQGKSSTSDKHPVKTGGAALASDRTAGQSRMPGINNLQVVTTKRRVKIGVFSRHLRATSVTAGTLRKSGLAIVGVAILIQPMELRAAPKPAADRHR